MNTIWAYGDSFVAGDQDIPGRVDAIEEHLNYNRYNISFASHLAVKLNMHIVNRAMSGCSNFSQVDQLWLDMPLIKKEDLIIFGLTTSWRDRFQIPHLAPQFLNSNRGQGLILRKLLNDNDNNRIGVADLFYVLSSLEYIENFIGCKIIKFHLFHNCLQDASHEDLTKFKKFNGILGHEFVGNTLIDVLTDNWGNNKSFFTISDHSKEKFPIEYKKFFTINKHPSKLGHKKIADWLHNIILNTNLL